MLAHIVPRESESISQYPFNASQVLTESSQNKFALFAARHLGAKQSKNQRIGSLANSSDGYLGCLGFEARQASTIDKRFRVLAYWKAPSSAIRSRAKLKMIKKADEKEAPLRGASSIISVNALSWLGTLDRRSRQLRQERQ